MRADSEVSMFEIRFPCAALRPFIECYWFLNTTVHSSHSLEELIFTDARADVVFTFSSPYVRTRADQPGMTQRIQSSHVDAQRRYPVRIHREGRAGLIWIRFRFGGLAAFVRAPIHELSGHIISLPDAFGPAAVELEESLCDLAGEPDAQAGLLDAFFLSRMSVPPGHRQVMSLIQIIERQRGVISVSDLSRAAGYSVRTIDRLFQRVIGLPPKFLARTVRLRHVYRSLISQPEITWGDIVASLDYFDESHLARDVLSLTGVAPQAYRTFLRQKERACLEALSSFYMTSVEQRV